MAPADEPASRRHRKNINAPGHAHALTFSCYRRFRFLARDRVCEWLVESIDNARQCLSFDVWAWVFMPDHVHLVLLPRQTEYDIAMIRRLIKEPVARKAIAYLRNNAPEWLKKLERQRGQRKEHVFWQSGGGYDRNIIQGETLLKIIDYLHENPVRKGFVTRAMDWKWSSAAWFVANEDIPLMPDPIPPDWLEEAGLGP